MDDTTFAAMAAALREASPPAGPLVGKRVIFSGLVLADAELGNDVLIALDGCPLRIARIKLNRKYVRAIC